MLKLWFVVLVVIIVVFSVIGVELVRTQNREAEKLKAFTLLNKGAAPQEVFKSLNNTMMANKRIISFFTASGYSDEEENKVCISLIKDMLNQSLAGRLKDYNETAKIFEDLDCARFGITP